MNRKKILVFGDSNSWGYNPCNKRPFPPYEQWEDGIRWTDVMQDRLGDGYLVLTDGLCGRTASAKDDIEPYTCGREQIIPALRSRSPLDLLVLMLGSNDLKVRYGYTAYDVAQSVGMVVETALTAKDAFYDCRPNVLLLCPPPLGDLRRSFFALEFQGSEETSKRMAPFFEIVAARYQTAYLNVGEYARFSDSDGLHLEADQHLRLGEAVAAKVKTLIPLI